jgi:DNA-binding transcriptional ArsR family regulator
METQTGEILNPVSFELPKRKRRIVEKEAPPDRRKFAVVPIKAIGDKRLHNLAIRILVCACSYANRAGITWVGQRRIAQDLGIHQSQISRELAKLKELGYVDLVSKGFRGNKGDTIRVVYDDSLSTSEAISIASAGQQDDLRPPEQRRKEDKETMTPEPEISEEQARDNQKRLAELIKTTFKTPNEANKQIYKPVKGDTMTVRKMKESIQKAKRKPVDNPVDKSVDNFIIDDIIDDMGVIINTKDICIDIVYKDNNNDKVINDKVITFDKVLTLVLTHDDKRSRLSEDDIGMLERLSNAGVTELELMQALRDHHDKSTAAMCREVLLSR